MSALAFLLKQDKYRLCFKPTFARDIDAGWRKGVNAFFVWRLTLAERNFKFVRKIWQITVFVNGIRVGGLDAHVIWLAACFTSALEFFDGRGGDGNLNHGGCFRAD